MLEPLGVTGFAEALYRVLVEHGTATGDYLADRLGAGVPDVTAALAALRGLGLVVPSGEQPGSWEAQPPEVTLASLAVRQQQALFERQRELDRAQRTVSELVRLSRARAHDTGSAVAEVTTDAEAVRRRRAHLARTAEESILVLDATPCGIQPAAPDDLGHEAGDRGLAERGVAIQVIYERSALLLPGRFETLRKLAGAGEQARTLPELPATVALYDRREAVVYLGEGEGEDVEASALWIRRSPLLAALLGLFDLLWERAVPLPPVLDELTADRGADFDEVLVALLAAGFKDESIARHLGVSPSTVTRRMARLMELTGTSTRFQLGMQAARRGWI